MDELSTGIEMTRLLETLPFNSKVEVYDFNGHEVWSGLVEEYPWSKTEYSVLEIRAKGTDSLSITVDLEVPTAKEDE